MSTNKKLKEQLMEVSDKCHWCGITVVVYPHIDGEIIRPDMATVDHLVSRFFRKKGEVVEKVLSCLKCNHKRGKEEEQKYGRVYKKGVDN